MKVTCPHCGEEQDAVREDIGRKVECSACRETFEIVNPNLVPCPDCFSPISRRAAVCPKCGAVLSKEGITQPGGDGADEKVCAVFHPSAINYLGLILLGILTIPLVIGLILLLAVIVVIKCTSYELTTRRIIVRKGLIAKYQDEIWIKDMRAVNLKQGVWQRIFGIGDIEIGTAASAGTEIRIAGIANPSEIVKKINSLRKS